MILTGRSLCLPLQATVQELFSVARDASIIPDISLDPVLTTFLSLDSSAALQHQYASLQRSMSSEQQTAFSLSLTEKLGGSRVTYGGVGVVALALSMLFDQVALQVRTQGSSVSRVQSERSQPKRIFGISSSSRIGWIIHSYLSLIPSIANNTEKVAETTELYDAVLKLELIDHFERMTTKKRMSSVSMQQWLVGAAVHLHIRIHQVRLQSVPVGSAESLRLSYKFGFGRLIQGYTTYLHRNVKETPRPRKPRTRVTSGLRQTSTLNISNMTCTKNHLLNASLGRPNISSDNQTTTNSAADISTSCQTSATTADFGVNETRRGNDTVVGVVNRRPLNSSAGHDRSEDFNMKGLLVIEPYRNVSHNVQHHPCESPAIQQALVTHIINTLDLERNRNFFFSPRRIFHSLLKQQDDFVIKTEQT